MIDVNLALFELNSCSKHTDLDIHTFFAVHGLENDDSLRNEYSLIMQDAANIV